MRKDNELREVFKEFLRVLDKELKFTKRINWIIVKILKLINKFNK